MQKYNHSFESQVIVTESMCVCVCVRVSLGKGVCMYICACIVRVCVCVCVCVTIHVVKRRDSRPELYWTTWLSDTGSDILYRKFSLGPLMRNGFLLTLFYANTHAYAHTHIGARTRTHTHAHTDKDIFVI